MPDAPAHSPPRTVYRMRRDHFARSLGRLLVIAAVAVVLTVLALEFLPAIAVLGVVVSTVLLVLAALAGISLMVPPTLLQLDDRGFRAHRRQISGPSHAPWKEVTRVGMQSVEAEPVLMIEHPEGKVTAIPLALADAPTAEIEREVRRRLDRAHGYRRLT